MKSRERVLASLNYQSTDKWPVDFGSTNVTSIHLIAYENLLKHLGIRQGKTEFLHYGQQIVKPCEELLQLFQVDTRPVALKRSLGSNSKFINDNEFIDDFGLIYKRPEGGLYFDTSNAPLKHAQTIGEILEYPWPDPSTLVNCDGVSEEAKALRENTDYAIVGTAGGATVYMSAQNMRSYEQLFIDMVSDTGLFEALLDRILEIRLWQMNKLLDCAGEYLDIIQIAEDITGQLGPLFAPELYRSLIKPRTKAIVDTIKSRYSHIKVLYHVCGSIAGFIEDFIEIGIDALTPVQVSAANMDTKMLQDMFGGRISFWGGINQQEILARGSPQDVVDEVKKRTADFGYNGGYVPFATHNIQADVCPENIIAMFDTINSFKFT